MGLSHSLEQDIFCIADNDPRTVIVYRRNSSQHTDDYAAGVTVTGVVREDLSYGTLGAGGATLPQGSAAFHLQALQLSYARPHPGDVLADQGGQRYSLDSVGSLGEETWYRVVGIPEVG